jgi:hypothetical protein
VRDYISRVATEGELDREIGGNDDVLRRRLRAIRDDARHDAARRELEELKQNLRPSIPETAAASEAVPAAERRSVPVVAG